MIKDYGWMFKEDIDWAKRAEKISGLACDITEIISELGLADVQEGRRATITYHSACSMQHGQKLSNQPKNLLSQAGFEVREPAEGHLCCGSAGTYNILQPALATQLRDRKAGHIAKTTPDVVSTGNIGCMTQLAGALDAPVVHTVELLDWATGGPKPKHLDM